MTPTKWWLSFADGTLPKGTQFLGACIVVGAEDIGAAVILAHAFGINPGGEVQGLQIPPSSAAHIPKRWEWRLLNRTECEHFDAEMAQAN